MKRDISKELAEIKRENQERESRPERNFVIICRMKDLQERIAEKWEEK